HPDITISTDVIVGFPTETYEEFMESVKLITDTKPDVLNFSKYWPRPGTEAAELKPIDGDAMKERTAKIKEVFDEGALENNKRWLGWEGEILIDEEGKNGTLVGRNYAYRPIILKGKFKIGDSVKVKIKKATTRDLRA
ncbi:MAG: TRAM domain-containing protein, partial [Candidatus Woesearchaeota archaeon]